MTHRDEIDKFLFDLVGVLPGCCSSVESVKYTIARTVAEALWPKKDSALTWEDMALAFKCVNAALDDCDGKTREEVLKDALRRFNELKKK